MFGDLIEKAQKLVKSVMEIQEARARKRACFQASAALISGIIASGVNLPDTPEKRALIFEDTLDIVRELERVVYARESFDEPDFDF